nr:ATP-binding cassette domain-containing protein [Gemmatimonadales bacterium]MBA3556715.1 ATP-binding cassette domain-containing protein [Gemmatimonadales bacterium]
RQASLVVGAGEIVGVAAVEGNGQRELLRAVAGRLSPSNGHLEVARPIGFIPEDRSTEGLIPEFTLTENVVLASSPEEPWIRGPRIDWSLARARTAELLDRFGIVAPGPDAPAGSLSGGNQQKLVVARELARSPAVVVAENPTRGLDVGAAEDVRRRLREAAAGGAAILFHSSDLDEVLALADRVIVASRGTILTPRPDASRSEIGSLMVAGTA